MRSPWLAPAIGAVPVLAMALKSEVTGWLKRRRADSGSLAAILREELHREADSLDVTVTEPLFALRAGTGRPEPDEEGDT